MRSTNIFAAFIVALASTASIQAETASEATASTTSTKRPRALSRESSSALSAGYSFQPPKPEPIVTEKEEIDLREVDKPRNEIIRLPKHVVLAKKPPVFSERDLYSKGNLEKLAMARYLSKFDRNGLNRWTLPGGFFSNEKRALEAYYADERLKNMAEIKDQAAMYKASGDDARAKQAMEDSYSTFIRVNEPTSKLPSNQGRY